MSIYYLKANALLFIMIFVASLPEILLAMKPTKQLDLTKFPYNTLVLISARLPTLLFNIGIPVFISRRENLKYKKYGKMFTKMSVRKNVIEFFYWIWKLSGEKIWNIKKYGKMFTKMSVHKNVTLNFSIKFENYQSTISLI